MLVFLIIIICEQRQYNVFSIRSHPFSSFILSIFSLSSPSLSTRISSTSSNSNNIYYRIMNIDKPCYNSSCEPAATGRRSKKTHGLSQMQRSLWPRIFLTFSFRCIEIINGFASVTACGCWECNHLLFCPKQSKCYALVRFVLFVRLVFEKNIRVYI